MSTYNFKIMKTNMATLSTTALASRNADIKSGKISKKLLQDKDALSIINALYSSLENK